MAMKAQLVVMTATPFIAMVVLMVKIGDLASLRHSPTTIQPSLDNLLAPVQGLSDCLQLPAYLFYICLMVPGVCA